jgi:hypothetical protein
VFIILISKIYIYVIYQTTFVVPYILKNVSEISGDGHRSECSNSLGIIVVPTAIKCEPLFKINLVSNQKRKIQVKIIIILLIF